MYIEKLVQAVLRSNNIYFCLFVVFLLYVVLRYRYLYIIVVFARKHTRYIFLKALEKKKYLCRVLIMNISCWRIFFSKISKANRPSFFVVKFCIVFLFVRLFLLLLREGKGAGEEA